MRADPPPGCAILIAGPDDAALFARVADDVFDGPVDPTLLAEFLACPRHHIAVARMDGALVGMITGVDHIHPDKPPQMWINELGVATTHRRRGIARALLSAFLGHACALGCTEAWVIADPTPEAEGFWTATGAARTGTQLAMFTFPL